MNISRKIVLTYLVCLFVGVVGAKSAYSAPTHSPGDKFSYKRQGVKLDQFARIVNSHDKGKINYIWNQAGIDIKKKGNSKAESVFFSNLPEDTLISGNNSYLPESLFTNSSFSFKEKWSAGVFGSGIGKTGIIVADIDNDGVIEIICGGSTSTFGPDNFWYVLEYSSVSQEYTMQWISSFYEEGISRIAAFDIGTQGIYTVFIGLANGGMHMYGGSTLEEVGFYDSPANKINNIVFADGDNDGINEIIFCDDYNMFFCNATSLSLEHQISYGAGDFEVGNVDTDDFHEIVLASGLVLEVNGESALVEWDYPGGFGYLVELSDIDSDNMQEIIGASSWYYVTAFDADKKSVKWQIATGLDVGALLLRDVDNDGIEDVLYGDGQWGEIHCYDAVTVTQKWQLDNPDHGVTDIAVFDTDADGDPEVLWGAGASSTGADHLHVHCIPTLLFEWQSQHVDGPFHAIDVGDVDSDGQQEIVFASFQSNSGYDDGIIFIHDAATHALEWQGDKNMFGDYAWTGIHDLKIGDVDDDGVQEIVVGTDRLYNGAIYIINGITHEMEQSYFYDSGAPIYSLAIADVDNDGDTEVIAGGGREHTGAPGVYVYVINGSTGVVEWRSTSLGDYWSEIYSLELGDIDNDPALEIVAVNDNIFVIDGVSHEQRQSTLSGCYGLDLHHIDDDGIKEIIVGTDTGNIIAVDGQTLDEEFNFNVCESSIVGLRAYDFDRNGNIEIIFASAGSLRVYSVKDSLVLWKSEMLGSSAGDYNGLVVSDIDSDRFTEVIIGASYKVVEFEKPTCDFDLDCDGISDDVDSCPNSDLGPTVVIDGCDTGVENHLLDAGCTISDRIAECASGAANHGKFVTCVKRLTLDMSSAGTITIEEKRVIDSCADNAAIP